MKSKINMTRVATFLTITLLSASSAMASTMLAMGRSGDTSTLLDISISPFSITPIGSTTLGRISGLDFDPTTGILYGNSGMSAPNPDSFFSIDPSNGAATLIGGLGDNMSDIGIANDGTIYGAGASRTGLFTINPVTGAASFVGSFINSQSIESIDVDPVTGILHGINFNDGEFYSINTTTGEATSLGSYLTAGLGNDITGLGIDSTGVAYISTGAGNGDIFRLNSDFTKDLIGSHDRSVSDITFRLVAVPEPGTLALFGIGLAGLGLARRRKAA